MKLPLSPELSLLLTVCLGQKPDIKRPEEVDWERLRSLASWHGVKPQLFHSDYQPIFPTRFFDWLRGECQHITMSNLTRTSELIRAMELLHSAAIPVYAYKGSLWAEWLYGGLNLREYDDIDLLVPPSFIPKAVEVLATADYRPDAYRKYLLEGQSSAAFLRSDYHIPLDKVLPDGHPNGIIELHWQIAYPRLCFDFPVSEWAPSAIDYPLQNSSVQSFTKEIQLLFLLLHHGGKERWMRLKYLADLTAYLRRYGRQTNWEEVTVRTKQLGVYPLLRRSLGLVSALGYDWTNDSVVPEVPPDLAWLVNVWEQMPPVSSNSSWPYFRHGLRIRNGVSSKRKLVTSHVQYLTEWKLLWHKARWYAGQRQEKVSESPKA